MAWSVCLLARVSTFQWPSKAHALWARATTVSWKAELTSQSVISTPFYGHDVTVAAEPVDEWEARLLAQHGPEVLRAVQRYLRPEKPKPRPRLKSSESAQPG